MMQNFGSTSCNVNVLFCTSFSLLVLAFLPFLLLSLLLFFQLSFTLFIFSSLFSNRFLFPSVLCLSAVCVCVSVSEGNHDPIQSCDVGLKAPLPRTCKTNQASPSSLLSVPTSTSKYRHSLSPSPPKISH